MELLSPAGTFDALRAAVQNGADAVYLGGSRFNARQSAGNFDDDALLRALDYAHGRGVRLHLALNTVLLEEEFQAAVEMAAFACRVGFDAVIVQDTGLAAAIRRELPELPLHASTQMTIHNLAGAAFAERSGFRRAVLARELSLEEIQRIHAGSGIELEVFGHGAMCVSWSGQCLMSALIGNRSGNRGACAQPCRLPWKVQTTADGAQNGTFSGYALSMRDLMTLEQLPLLKAAGVASLKIEGRMKSPEYVAVVTAFYRKYLDRLEEPDAGEWHVEESDVRTLRQLFSRGGFSSRYLTVSGARTGSALVDAAHQKHAGLPLGRVEDVQGVHALVTLAMDMTLGDGVEVRGAAIANGELPSTVVTDIKTGSRHVSRARHVQSASAGETVWLGDFRRLPEPGAMAYRTSEKRMMEQAASTFAKDDRRQLPVFMHLSAFVGRVPRLSATDAEGNAAAAEGAQPCEAALRTALAAERAEEQLSRTGGTPFRLGSFELETDGMVSLPASALNAMRRDVLDRLERVRLDSFRREPQTDAEVRGTGHRTRNADDRLVATGGQRNADSRMNAAGIAVDHAPFDDKTAAPRVVLQFMKPPEIERLVAIMAVCPPHADLMLPASCLYVPLADDESETVAWTDERLGALASAWRAARPDASIWLDVPGIVRETDMERLLSLLDMAAPLVDGYCVSNPAFPALLHARWPGKRLTTGIGMNVWNAASTAVFTREGARDILVSPELNVHQIAVLAAGPVPGATVSGESALEVPASISVLARGSIPVMTVEHCPSSLAVRCDGRCARCPGRTGVMTDRVGATFPYLRDPLLGHTILFHHKPYRLDGFRMSTFPGLVREAGDRDREAGVRDREAGDALLHRVDHAAWSLGAIRFSIWDESPKTVGEWIESVV